MAALPIRVPFPVFYDQDGQPVDNGRIYIGTANLDPVANAIPTYYDEGLSIAASQPIITSGGYPVYQGTPTNVFVNAPAYSITVKNSDNTLVYSDLFVSDGDTPSVSLAELPDVPASEDNVIFLNDSGREGQFICRAGATPSDPLEGIYVDSNTPNFYWERVWDNINGYPEWFGAVSNSNSGSIPANNVAAIHACLALCSVVNFRRADYWTNDTIKLNVQYRTIRGEVMSDGYNTGTGTRILSNNAAANVIQVGPDSAPGGGTSAYYRNITVQNLCARWGVVLTPPASGSESSAVKGWLVNYVLNCQIRNCSAWEPIIGFYMYGCVYTKFDDCAVFRSTAYGGANDFFRGFWAQGAPAILNGGNPSLFIDRCNVSIGASPALVSPTGLFANANLSDMFIDQFEVSAVHTGISIDGTGANAGASSINIHIRNSILDQCSQNGIIVSALNGMGMLTINGGYVQVNDTGVSGKGIWLTGSVNNGSVSIGGGIQIVSSTGTGTSNRGIYISQQSNVKVDSSVIIEDFYAPVDIDGGSVQFDIRPTITNPNTGNGTSAAVSINGASRGYVAPSVTGGSAKFAQGVLSSGTGLDKTVIDPTMFNATAIAGGAVGKIVVNSVAITSPGYYTTAGVSGTSGAGIYVTGITA